MVSSLPTPCSSEHWRTIMMCTVCENTPDRSPLFRCSMGHLICGTCFEKMLRKRSMIQCVKCKSRTFRQCCVSQDFLRKLKTKPGIGRRRRYRVVDLKKSSSNLSDFVLDEQETDSMTIEKLFRLTSNQVELLFEATAREKYQAKGKMMPGHSWPTCLSNSKFERGDIGNHQSFAKGSHAALDIWSSKKPLLCPHYDCKKLITISSYITHFHHDHSDIPSYIIERGKVLHLIHDVRVIEFNTTFCMAIFNVFEKENDVFIGTLGSSVRQTAMVGTFWLMVSGSVEERKSKSYVLYWLSTNRSEPFSCTIEVSSVRENFSSSTFCGVNKITDSYSIADVAYRLNCLNLCYASMRNILHEGCNLHLRVTVH